MTTRGHRPDRWDYDLVNKAPPRDDIGPENNIIEDEDDGVGVLKIDNEPSPHELATLRRVPAKIPWTAFVIALVELCERFAFYGLSGPFQNYISNAWGSTANPGALGELCANV
jgi:hypothetical protein